MTPSYSPFFVHKDLAIKVSIDFDFFDRFCACNLIPQEYDIYRFIY